MKLGGLVFPDADAHFAALGDSVIDYQRPQSDYAISLTRQHRVAVDVGAHVGIFTKRFAEVFDQVIAIEPNPGARFCLRLNVPTASVVEAAAVDFDGALEIHLHDSGWSYIDDPRASPPKMPPGRDRRLHVPAITLDSLELPIVDLLKIDVQGAEALVLLGAMGTLRRCCPVVLVEEKGALQSSERCAQILATVGAHRVKRIGADAIWVFPDQPFP